VKSTGTAYDHVGSHMRIRPILDENDTNCAEVDSLPSRDRLTYTNGFYANCAAMIVDIRNSSQLPSKYKRPRLAKLYRGYISEAVAAMDGNVDCREVNIVGDARGVYSTRLTGQTCRRRIGCGLGHETARGLRRTRKRTLAPTANPMFAATLASAS